MLTTTTGVYCGYANRKTHAAIDPGELKPEVPHWRHRPETSGHLLSFDVNRAMALHYSNYYYNSIKLLS